MLAGDEHSTNNGDHNDEGESLTIPPRPSIMRKLSRVFSAPRLGQGADRLGTNSLGYEEFGAFSEESSSRTLGTFAGVFAPVTLSMFSALIFLRMGYIVGNAGLLTTVSQFVIAYIILVFTVMSVCAISTNGAVEGGGAYFMISRTLGPEFGGSIGTLFFLANIVSSALCISGCVEGLIENFGPTGYLKPDLIREGRWWGFLYCTCLNILNLLVCLIGAAMFAKTTVFILILVCGCLGIMFFSFLYEGPLSNLTNGTNTVYGNYTGLRGQTMDDNMWPQYGKDYTANDELVSFSTVFGVLFSGVTGIMAGANMSGELKNPGKSIPLGTLSAVGFTFLIYLGCSMLVAATCTSYLLQNNYLFLAGVSTCPVSVAIGLLTATWSAALSNAIGGSRVLEALAKDNVFGPALNFIPRGTWNGNPVAAVFVSALLVEFVLLIGSLNLIAQLNSVLFLLSYLATNMACLGLELAGAPNFRPTFMFFTWHTALIGLLGTLIMMMVISPIYASCSILLCLLLIVFLHVFSPSKEAQWGSISQALIFHQVRKYLLLLDIRKDHVKFWRPQVLLLVDSPRSACPLIDFINDLKKGGLYVLGHVEIEEEDKMVDNVGEQAEQQELKADPTITQTIHWLNLVDHLKVKAFVELTVAKSVREGMQHLVRLSGMGAMKPNTVIIGFLNKEDPTDFLSCPWSPYYNEEFENDVFPIRNQKSVLPLEYVQMMGDVLRMNKNLCLCRNFGKLKKDVKSVRTKKYIDVWPVNFIHPGEGDAFDTTSLFMLQLACIVNMVPIWSRLKLRVRLCEDGQSQGTLEVETHPAQTTPTHRDRLTDMLTRLRIEAQLTPDKFNDTSASRGNGSDLHLPTSTAI
nr:unnamed protein product [Callosobruchus chinensis]